MAETPTNPAIDSIEAQIAAQNQRVNAYLESELGEKGFSNFKHKTGITQTNGVLAEKDGKRSIIKDYTQSMTDIEAGVTNHRDALVEKIATDMLQGMSDQPNQFASVSVIPHKYQDGNAHLASSTVFLQAEFIDRFHSLEDKGVKPGQDMANYVKQNPQIHGVFVQNFLVENADVLNPGNIGEVRSQDSQDVTITSIDPGEAFKGNENVHDFGGNRVMATMARACQTPGHTYDPDQLFLNSDFKQAVDDNLERMRDGDNRKQEKQAIRQSCRETRNAYGGDKAQESQAVGQMNERLGTDAKDFGELRQSLNGRMKENLKELKHIARTLDKVERAVHPEQDKKPPNLDQQVAWFTMDPETQNLKITKVPLGDLVEKWKKNEKGKSQETGKDTEKQTTSVNTEPKEKASAQFQTHEPAKEAEQQKTSTRKKWMGKIQKQATKLRDNVQDKAERLTTNVEHQQRKAEAQFESLTADLKEKVSGKLRGVKHVAHEGLSGAKKKMSALKDNLTPDKPFSPNVRDADIEKGNSGKKGGQGR